MNKFLLGTTALVASGMIAGAASAAEPIALKIGGAYNAAFVLHDDDAPGTANSSVKQDVEIVINGSTVLDSGVTVGFQFEIQDQAGDSTFGAATNEEVFAYVEGGLGRTEIGSHDSAAFLMAYVAPAPTGAHGVDTPFFLHLSRISARTNARVSMSGEANKVNYFTPRMSGFQLGASYTPSNDCVGAGPVFSGAAPLVNPDFCTGNANQTEFGVRGDADGGVEDILELAVNYVGKWGAVDVAMSAAYGWGDHESAGLTGGGVGIASPISGDPEAYSLGLNLATMGWTFGGAWYQSEDLVLGTGVAGAGKPGVDEEAWNLGLTYATGPWQVGVAYLDSEQDRLAGAPLAIAGPAQLTLYDIGAQYTLGPGIKIGADITLAEDEIPAAAGTAISPSSIEDKALALTLMLAF